jgi:outer membrane protein OmpA-like peptidoglycan-associated protein
MSGPHKKGGHEEGGGHAPAWIVSFADMVILLMSFFVLLLCQGSQKTTADEDLLKILASVKLQFGYKPKPNSTDPIDLAVMQCLSQRQNIGFRHSGLGWRSPAVKGKAEKERDNWVKSQSPIGKPFYFDRGSAEVTDAGDDNLQLIAEIVRTHYRMIIIQGHCSTEEAKDGDGDDLTYRRAKAVKDILKKYGVAEKRLAIVALSSNASPNTVQSDDRQLAIVTIGSYYLPTENDVIDNGPMLQQELEKPAGQGGH